MDALAQPPHDRRQLHLRRDQTRALVDQHRDLAARLAQVHAAHKDGNTRMDVAVPLGVNFEAEGVVPDTSRVIVAAGLDDLFLDLELEHALVFVDKRTSILNQKLKTLDEHVARLEKEHDMVVKTLRTAFQLPDDDSKA
ncbi:uncharacterized protein RHOBADRAFT_45005 [Rhodotorula graminis WP1]|uniref:Prefoldin subunit n=1 Tax=Rhodotorula graminis (strain WP1) TaxID=578459 RepID=A0A194S523_RHOGW|nr:uncharacterized protein RHOBADRAFT_45005 [Rhodotorula graminis WP1]KPV74516.1 hypothetical protein RHOBADRAFT_45005 [Rhodotorula graminis WP1]